METIKELCLKSKDSLCTIEKEAIYRFRFPGFFSGFKSHKNVFVSMSNVYFRPIRRNVKFKFYYGEKRNLMESDFADFQCSYGSLDELCSILSYYAMQEKEEKKEEEDEKDEEKEDKTEEQKKFKKVPLEISILNGRCSLKVPVGHVAVISGNLNKVLKLKVVEDENYPVQLLCGDHMGMHIEFFKEDEKKCYVSIDRMVNSFMLNSGFEVSNVLNFFDFEKKKMGPSQVKRCVDLNDEFMLSLKNDCFKPFIMDCENLCFEVTLNFLVPI